MYAESQDFYLGVYMKKILAAAFSLAGLSVGAADAADLAVRPAPPVVAAPACANFGGGYIGGNVGWTYYEHRYSDLDRFGLAVSTVDQLDRGKLYDSSWNVGPQIGYNWQSGCALVGIQADWSWTDANARVRWTDFGQQLDAGYADLSSKMQWFGTARLRTGVVVNDLLLYVTGGAAFAKFDRNFFYSGNSFTPTATAAFDSTRVGFAVGLGTEWAWTPNLSVVSEFLYLGFSKDKQTLSCPNTALCVTNLGVPVGTPYRYEFNDSAFVSRIGLNYRFGGGAPVVAKY